MAKKPAEKPMSDEEQDMQEIEQKVKRMLDPAEPEVPDELPSEIKIEPKTGDAQPSTAPELKPSKKSMGSKIAVKDNSDDDHQVDVSTTKKAEEVALADTSVEITEDGVEEIAEPVPEAPVASEEVTDTDVPTNEDPEDGANEISDVTEDEETSKAVDEISRQDSDELLAAEDKEIAKAFDNKKPSLLGRVNNFFNAWWGNRTARRLTIAALIVGLVTTATVPTSRYFMLNTFGVRSGASIKVLDQSTRQPLKNVQVSLRGKTVLTDDDGVARLTDLKLGSAELLIEKRAFAPIKQPVILGWGSNPLNDQNLVPVGSQYSFIVTDYLSGKPVHKAEAVSGEASAFSDEKGKIKLTIEKTDDNPVEVTVTKQDMREERLTINADDKSEHARHMVPARKHVFITKRSGNYDVYKIDIDGKNEELMLAGTGSERSDIALLPSHTDDTVAVVSTRANQRNSEGYLLSTLNLVDLSDNSATEVAKSERIQLIDWIGNKLIYVRIAAGTSAANPARHRLISYDYETAESKEIASSNFFNDVVVVDGVIYYAPSSAYQTSSTSLYKINSDGTNRQTVFAKETWNMYRTGYGVLTLAVGQDWYEYEISSNTSNDIGGEPANLRPRAYADSPNDQHSLWVDQRDGKGVLLAYDIAKNEDKEIYKQSGLKTPIKWLNSNSVIFRIDTDQETADYAVSLDGGEPKKIRDVSSTADISDWYYY